jgi:hypothetical protein
MPKNRRILWRMRETAPKRIFPVLHFVFLSDAFVNFVDGYRRSIFTHNERRAESGTARVQQ